jgi:hypothetical protein
MMFLGIYRSISILLADGATTTKDQKVSNIFDKKPMDEVMEKVMVEAEQMIGESAATWDACKYVIANFVIPEKTTHDQFFCDKHFPGLPNNLLYPEPNPMNVEITKLKENVDAGLGLNLDYLFNDTPDCDLAAAVIAEAILNNA